MARTKRHRMLLTFKPELQQQLKAAAVADDLSMAAWVRGVLIQELRKRVAVGAYEDPPPHSPDQENLPQ